MSELVTLVAEPWADWGLIDCGNGQKLERYGEIKVVRPEPQAMWAPAGADWDPDATFVPGSDEEGGGRWVQHRPVPRQWELARGPVRFSASLTPFRHLGFFPDMAPQWDWMRARAADADVLNLFGYTGVGTLLLSEAGARLVHVDASKKSVEQGKDNAKLSGLDRPPDPLDRRRRLEIHRARGSARPPLRRHPARPAQVRPRARRRGVAARGKSRAACSPTAASWSTPRAGSWCSPSMPCACPRSRSAS